MAANQEIPRGSLPQAVNDELIELASHRLSSSRLPQGTTEILKPVQRLGYIRSVCFLALNDIGNSKCLLLAAVLAVGLSVLAVSVSLTFLSAMPLMSFRRASRTLGDYDIGLFDKNFRQSSLLLNSTVISPLIENDVIGGGVYRLLVKPSIRIISKKLSRGQGCSSFIPQHSS